ncbi:hypothetical protein K449DRAFT_435820 [Hypoxylon sp. EC38]|nr:hypothetical protein K449DRAFT_435820 [Hypoxylon sp. EC38]
MRSLSKSILFSILCLRCGTLVLPIAHNQIPTSEQLANRKAGLTAQFRRSAIALRAMYINFPVKQPITARLAQSVERETLNLKVAGSTPASGSNPDASVQQTLRTNFFSLFFSSSY